MEDDNGHLELADSADCERCGHTSYTNLNRVAALSSQLRRTITRYHAHFHSVVRLFLFQFYEARFILVNLMGAARLLGDS